jgi:glycosyltransferase involved in cell wall biosynthesis
MRVVINQLATLGRKTGIGHYTRQLLLALRSHAPESQIDGFPDGWVRGACRTFTRARPYLEPGMASAPRPGIAQNVGVRGHALQYLRRRGRAVLAKYFRTVCAREQYDLYHEPNFIPFPSDRLTVATLHDLSVLLHPEWHPADRVAYYEQTFRRGIKQCAHFFAGSEFTRQEIIRTLNIPAERVTRTYIGVRAIFRRLPAKKVARALRELGLPPRYLLYLGTIEPRKNVLRLLRAYCSLPASVRNHWPLLLVGNWGWASADVADYLHAEARHRGVIHVGYVAEKHLAAVYNGARALLYPSWYEGFGLPPVEMMACGGAVLASTAAALVETVGKRAHLVCPADVDGWRDSMLQVVQDDDWWLSLRKGARALARPFTWRKCAAETLAVYNSLCGIKSERWATADFQSFERVSSPIAPHLPPPVRSPRARAG